MLRNYTWELLIAEIFKKQKLLTLKSEVVKFRVNGDVRGLYVVEEVPSKVTLERQKRKDGPIFGLDENYILNSEGLLDVYDLKYCKDKQIYNFAKKIYTKISILYQMVKKFFYQTLLWMIGQNILH